MNRHTINTFSILNVLSQLFLDRIFFINNQGMHPTKYMLLKCQGEYSFARKYITMSKKQEMFALIDEFENSYLKARAFCKAKGLVLSTFYYWKKKNMDMAVPQDL